jgi:AcrR family transcriptional regulator
MSLSQSDQRARLLDSTTIIVAERGYLGAKIGDIASRAGVSRATFYDLFENKEGCFLAAQERGAADTCQRVEAAVARANGQSATRACLTAMVELADDEPHSFLCLTRHATVAGRLALARREQLLERLGELVSCAQACDGLGQAPDIPPAVLLGAAARTVGMYMQYEEPDFGALLEGLVAWSELYTTPIDARRWCGPTSEPVLLEAAEGSVSAVGFPPADVPRGRHRMAPAVTRHSQRERILRATAAAVSAKGYEHTTVADIVSTARLSRDVFYAHMGSRREALDQAARLFFERSVAAVAGAFFAGPNVWRERVWTAGSTLAQFLRAAPDFVRLALIDAYAPGPDAARRSDELLLGFRFFVEQGATESPDAHIPSLTPYAILFSLVECVVQLIATDRLDELPGILGFGTFLTVVPFIGVDAGNEFVEEKSASCRSAAPARRR